MKGAPRVEWLEGRALLSGGLDPSFDGDGRAVVQFGQGGFDDAEALGSTVQPDGKVVVVGQAFIHRPVAQGGIDFAIQRLNADGSLDPTFGDGGRVVIDFGSHDQAMDVDLLADGRIVVVGRSGDGQGRRAAVALLGAEGSLDPSFDGDGRLVFDLASNGAYEVAWQEGGIVVAGNGDTPELVRLTTVGAFDPGFGTSGTGRLDLADFNWVNEMAAGPGGTIVLLGSPAGLGSDDFRVGRLLSDGSDDPSFGSLGRVALDLPAPGGPPTLPVALVVQPGGAILTLGSNSGGPGGLVAARLDSAGALDPGFDGDGIAQYEVASVAVGLANGPNGTSYLLGSSSDAGATAWRVARIGADGALDPGFDGDGVASISLGGSPAGIVATSDGLPVAVGTAGGRFAAVRWQTDGTADPDFGTGGSVTHGFLQDDLNRDFGTSVALSADGQVTAAGVVGLYDAASPFSSGAFGAARLRADGTLDTAFAENGRSILPLGLGGAEAVAVASDGSVILAGSPSDSSGFTRMVVARLKNDGTLDTEFGEGGSTSIGFDHPAMFPASDHAAAVVLQSDGKIVVAGWSEDAVQFSHGASYTARFAIIRLNADGTLDSTFGDAGRVLIDFPGPTGDGTSSFDQALGLAIATDGRIIVGGNVAGYPRSLNGSGQIRGDRFGIAVLNPDGSLDPTFGIDGLSTVDFESSETELFGGLALGVDGTIALVGSAEVSEGGTTWALARLLPEGGLDPSFDGDGRATLDLGERAAAVATRPGGRLVVAGAGAGDIAVAWLRADGSLDLAMGVGGVSRADFGGVDVPAGLAWTDDGRVVVVGTTTRTDNGQSAFAVARLVGQPAVEGDYDGDGTADLATYSYDASRDVGTFALRLSNRGSAIERNVEVSSAGAGSIPVAGDFDGDGRADVALFNPSGVVGGGTTPNASIWTILRSSREGQPNQRLELAFGGPSGMDVPVPADYDGDGTTDLAVFRADVASFRADSDLTPGAAEWFVLPSGSGLAFRVAFGAGGGSDLPVPADYDGDGRADVATFRAESDLVADAAQYFVLPSSLNPGYGTTVGGFASVVGQKSSIAAPAVYSGARRAEAATFDRSLAQWTIRELPDGAARLFTFGGTGAGVVPVLSPLASRKAAGAFPSRFRSS